MDLDLKLQLSDRVARVKAALAKLDSDSSCELCYQLKKYHLPSHNCKRFRDFDVPDLLIKASLSAAPSITIEDPYLLFYLPRDIYEKYSFNEDAFVSFAPSHFLSTDDTILEPEKDIPAKDDCDVCLDGIPVVSPVETTTLDCQEQLIQTSFHEESDVTSLILVHTNVAIHFLSFYTTAQVIRWNYKPGYGYIPYKGYVFSMVE